MLLGVKIRWIQILLNPSGFLLGHRILCNKIGAYVKVNLTVVDKTRKLKYPIAILKKLGITNVLSQRYLPRKYAIQNPFTVELYMQERSRTCQ